jgi:hypothetical protein
MSTRWSCCLVRDDRRTNRGDTDSVDSGKQKTAPNRTRSSDIVRVSGAAAVQAVQAAPTITR